MKTKNAAFSLTELLIVVAVLTLILSFGVPALRQARVDATVATSEQFATKLNEAVTRATLDGDTNPVLSGNDVDALYAYVVAAGYLRED